MSILGIGRSGSSGGAASTTAEIDAVYSAEAIDYANRIAAVGGTIDMTTLGYIDEFIKTGKRDGWWSKMLDVYLPYGSNLASGLLKLKYEIGVDAFLTAGGGFTSAGYSQDYGVGYELNPLDAYLSSDFVPADHGLSTTNFQFTASIYNREQEGVGTDINGGIGAIFGSTSRTNQSGVKHSFAVLGGGPSIQTTTGKYAGNSTPGSITTASLNSGTVVKTYNNGTLQTSYSTTSGTTVLDTEIDLLRYNHAIGIRYGNGYCHGYAVSGTLTDAEVLSLNIAMSKLQLATRFVGKRRKMLLIGDSIVWGQGSDYYAEGADARWAYQATQALGFEEVGFAQSSMRLATDNGVYPSFYSKRNNIHYYPFDEVMIMIGTNDMSADSGAGPQPALVADFKTKLNTVVKDWVHKKIKVTLVSSPWNTWDNDEEMTAYVDATAEVAKDNNCHFIDTYLLFADETDPDSFFPDGTHPNLTGHSKIAEKVIKCYGGSFERSPKLNFSSIAAGASEEIAVKVMNIDSNMTATVGLPSTIEAGLIANAYVSNDNEVTIRLTNITGSPIDPAEAVFKVMVK
tara:strand:- start:66438 stop:68144 length:1707 start_codon:yes stop_codon:yes gene_type:complete